MANDRPRDLFDLSFTDLVRRDLSVSGWNMLALKASYIVGADVPGEHEAIERAFAYTKTVTYGKGNVGYRTTLCYLMLYYWLKPPPNPVVLTENKDSLCYCFVGVFCC